MTRWTSLAAGFFLSGCFSWNMHLPASPIGAGSKEVLAYGALRLSPAYYPSTTDGPLGLRLRLGSSAERDLALAFAFERPCNPSPTPENPSFSSPSCGGSTLGQNTTAYRFEVGMQHNYFESQEFYLSQGEGFSLAYLPGYDLPLAPGLATWFTVGYVIADPFEMYVSGRLSSPMSAVVGARFHYFKFTVGVELGIYVPLNLTDPNRPIQPERERIGLSIAVGYADDTRLREPLPLVVPSTLPPPPPPPPIPAPPPPPRGPTEVGPSGAPPADAPTVPNARPT